MNDLLLTTKLSVPLIRTDLAPRQRLIDQLNANLWQADRFARKLTLVSAAAGYGKTTLVADWLRKTGLHAAWLSLDEGDNDPARFLAYLLAALQMIDARIGIPARAMLQSPQPPPGEIILTTVINDLAGISRPFFLVLDDYHVILNPTIQKQVAFLLEHQPANMLQVILTREDPLLPVSRLRSHGLVHEIRQEDLRFTLEETAVFLNQIAGLNLIQIDLDTLHNRTEGWITGLQLAALSMQGFQDPHHFILSFAGSNRFVLDYLFDEVFSRLPVATQEFLVKTAILDRLTSELCNAVTGNHDSREQLEALERANLFIVPFEPSREWYRYHHLFRDLLRHQLNLQADISQEQLHRQASAWFQDHGYLVDAVQHTLAGRDWESAAGLIERAGEEMLKRGEIVTLIDWFKKVPQDIACGRPELCMTFAWALLLASQYDVASPLLDHAEQLAQPGSDFLGEVAVAQAFLARIRGDYPRLIEKSQLALSLLPVKELVGRSNVALNLGLAYWHIGRLDEAGPVLLEAQDLSRRVGNAYTFCTAQIFLARTLASKGKLRQAAALYPKIIQEGGNIPILALAYFDLCTIHYEWNDLQKTGEYLQRGLEVSTLTGNVEFQTSGYLLQAILALAQGDSSAALKAVEQSHTLADAYGPATRARSAACHVQIALAIGDLEMATLYVDQATDNQDTHSFYRFLSLARARWLLAIGQKDAAAEQLKACSESAIHAGWGYALIAVRVLQALAASTRESALEFLEEAIRLAQHEGFIRTFTDAGNQLAPLLTEVALRGIHPEYVGQILSAMAKGLIVAAPEQSILTEALSERELEVLRLVTAGLSNREIAGKLFISTGTAKTHIHNICGKLGVRNRTEAAMRAKDLRLV